MSNVDASIIANDPAFLNVVRAMLQKKATSASSADPDAWYAAQIMRGGFNLVDYGLGALSETTVAASIDMGAGSPLYGIEEAELEAGVDMVWDCQVDLNAPAT